MPTFLLQGIMNRRSSLVIDSKFITDKSKTSKDHRILSSQFKLNSEQAIRIDTEDDGGKKCLRVSHRCCGSDLVKSGGMITAGYFTFDGN